MNPFEKASVFPLLAGLIAFISLGDVSTFAQTPVGTQSPGESLSNDRLQARLITACDQASLPAIWAGRFCADDRPAIFQAAGKRRWNARDLAEPNDIVHLGSCTKAMTAVILGQLCGEGKLRLDTTLGEIFHDVPKVTQSDWNDVSIKAFFQHRSGIKRDFFLYQSFDHAHPDDVVAARRALLEAACDQQRLDDPGFAYSNIGFIILGHVAEHIEGKAWEEIIQERIFDPLEMASAGFGPVGMPDGSPKDLYALPGRAWGHTPAVNPLGAAMSLFGGKASPHFTPLQTDNARCLGPAGRVHMNLSDWSKFVLPFASEDGHERLKVPQAVWTEMLTPPPGTEGIEAYAAGWIVFNKEAYGGRAYFHNGSNTTWYCYALAIPAKRQCILVATNVFSDSARKECDAVAHFINDFSE